MLGADQRFVVAIQLEKAPIESWDHLLELDFHIAVLDVPQLGVEIGLYDALLASPPAGDGTLASRLESTARWPAQCWGTTRRLLCTRASA